MKVNINITVEFDPANWTTAFGIEGADEIREDVKTYVGGLVSEGQSVFTNGEVTLKSVSWK